MSGLRYVALLCAAVIIACQPGEAVDPDPGVISGIVGGDADAGELADAGAASEDAGGVDAGEPDAGGPPRIIQRSPAEDETGVEPSAHVTAVFDSALDPASVNGSTFIVTADGGVVAGSVSYDDPSRSVVFTPTLELTQSQQFTARLTRGVKSATGVPLKSDESWSFTTKSVVPPDTTPPSVIATAPDAGDSGVATTAVITAQFSEDVQAATVTSASISLTRVGAMSNEPVRGTVQFDPATRTATFAPSAPLLGSSSYVVAFGAGIKDGAGNGLVPSDFWFTTETDSTSPTVVAATGKPHAFSFTFSEPLEPSTVNATSVAVTWGADGGTLPGVVTYDSATKTAAFVPTGALPQGETLTATVTTGVTDLAGNALAADYSTTLTPDATTTAPRVVSTAPSADARLVPRFPLIRVTFDQDLDETTVNSTNLFIQGRASSVSYDAATKTATLTPTLSFLPSSTATVTVRDVKSAAGVVMPAPYSWTFRVLGDPVKLSADTLPDVRNLVTATSSAGTMAAWLAYPGTGGRLQWALRQGGSWTGGTLSQDATLTDAVTLVPMGQRFGARFVSGVTPEFRVFDNGTWTATTSWVDGEVSALNDLGVTVAWSTGGVDAYTLAPGSTNWVGPTPLAASGAFPVLARSGNLLGATYRVYASSTTCRLAFRRFDGTSWSAFEANIATANGNCTTNPGVRLVGNGTTFAASYLDGQTGANVAIYDVANDAWTVTNLGAAQGPVELATDGTGFAAFFRNSTHVMASTWSGASWSTAVQVDTDPTAIDRVVGGPAGYAAFRNATGGTLLSSVVKNGVATNTQLEFPGGSSGAKTLSAIATSTGFAVTYTVNANTFLRAYENGAWTAKRQLNLAGVSRSAELIDGAAPLLLSSDAGKFTAATYSTGTALSGEELIPVGEVRGSAGIAQPAMRSDGSMLVAWPQYDAGEPACFARYFDGAYWSAPKKLAIPMVGAPIPERCLAVTNGRVFVVAWIQQEGSKFAVYAARWSPDVGLGTAVRVSSNSLNASDLKGESDGVSVALIWSSNSPGRGSGNIAASTTFDGVTWSAPTYVLPLTGTMPTYEPVNFAASAAGYIFSTYAFGSTVSRAVAFGGASGAQNLVSGAAKVAAGPYRLAVLDSSTLYLNSGSAFSSVALGATGAQSAIAPFGPEFRIAVNGSTYLTSGDTLGAAGAVQSWTTGEVAMRCDGTGCAMFGRRSPNYSELRMHYTQGNSLVELGTIAGNAKEPQLYFAGGRYGVEYVSVDANKQASETFWIWE